MVSAKELLEKLKAPLFWVVLVGIVANELQPMLDSGKHVDILAVVKIVVVAFMGLLTKTPAALGGAKKDVPQEPSV